MPLEIKELHIKATVGEPNQGAGNTSSNQGSSENKDAIIQEVLEKVLQMLKDKEAR